MGKRKKGQPALRAVVLGIRTRFPCHRALVSRVTGLGGSCKGGVRPGPRAPPVLGGVRGPGFVFIIARPWVRTMMRPVGWGGAF